MAAKRDGHVILPYRSQVVQLRARIRLCSCGQTYENRVLLELISSSAHSVPLFYMIFGHVLQRTFRLVTRIGLPDIRNQLTLRARTEQTVVRLFGQNDRSSGASRDLIVNESGTSEEGHR